MSGPEPTSTRPYLIRALHAWCTDNGFTPFLAVLADETVRVPREYVKDGEIVLNVGLDATSALQLGLDTISFKARFAGRVRDIEVPVDRVLAIYARETGQGMAFPTGLSDPNPAQTSAAPAKPTLASVPGTPASSAADDAAPADAGTPATPPNDTPPPSGTRPQLKRIK